MSTLTRKRVGQRLFTVIGKLDTLISDTAAFPELMTERERATLREAFNLMAPVERDIYYQENRA